MKGSYIFKFLLLTTTLPSSILGQATTPCCQGWSVGYKYGRSFPNYMNTILYSIAPVCECYRIIGNAGYKEGYDLGFAKGLEDSRKLNEPMKQSAVYSHQPLKYSTYISQLPSDDVIAIGQYLQNRLNAKRDFYTSWFYKTDNYLSSHIIRQCDKDYLYREWNKLIKVNNQTLAQGATEWNWDHCIKNAEIFESDKFYIASYSNETSYNSRKKLYNDALLSGTEDKNTLFLLKQSYYEGLYWLYHNNIYEDLGPADYISINNKKLSDTGHCEIEIGVNENFSANSSMTQMLVYLNDLYVGTMYRSDGFKFSKKNLSPLNFNVKIVSNNSEASWDFKIDLTTIKHYRTDLSIK